MTHPLLLQELKIVCYCLLEFLVFMERYFSPYLLTWSQTTHSTCHMTVTTVTANQVKSHRADVAPFEHTQLISSQTSACLEYVSRHNTLTMHACAVIDENAFHTAQDMTGLIARQKISLQLYPFQRCLCKIPESLLSSKMFHDNCNVDMDCMLKEWWCKANDAITLTAHTGPGNLHLADDYKTVRTWCWMGNWNSYWNFKYDGVSF